MTATETAPRYGAYACPSCGKAREQAALEIRTATTAETSVFADLREHWRGFFKEKALFSYYRCSGCGMLYSPTYFTSDQLDDLYRSMGPNMEGVNEGALERTQLGYLRELRRVSDLTGDFLEIGPDVGLFAEHCVREGHFSKFWMCEPNVAVHDEIRARLKDREYSISTSLLDLQEIPDETISVAVMIHVLDHILSPLDFLKSLHSKLTPQGIAMIVTHDERSLLAKTLKVRWPAYCLQHPHLFNPRSIRAMLDAAGFETIAVVRSVNHFPVTFLVRHLAYALKLGDLKLPAWPGLALPLKLGNMITLARRKS